MNSKITLSAPLTMSDWMCKPLMDKYEFGDEAVRYILTRCREFGLTRVYWRTFDAGLTNYSSKLADPYYYDNHEPYWQYSEGWFAEPQGEALWRCKRVDMRNFDSLESAVRIGHELGLEIYGWITINEDDHGIGATSRFTREHPEFHWVRRNGFPYNSQLSFAFPEVREYKLGLIKELLAYNIDGLFLDWIRTGDISDNPQTDAEGFADYGYEQPNLDLFKKLYLCDAHNVPNCDARWVDVRCKPQTEFMRSVREAAGDKKIVAMVQHPYAYRGVMPWDYNKGMGDWIRRMRGNLYAGSKEGLLCDIRTWANEGLMDAVMVSGYFTCGGTPEMAMDYLKEMVGDKVERQAYFWLPTKPGNFTKDMEIARRCGMNEVLLWEADYMDNGDEETIKAIQNEVHEQIG